MNETSSPLDLEVLASVGAVVLVLIFMLRRTLRSVATPDPLMVPGALPVLLLPLALGLRSFSQNASLGVLGVLFFLAVLHSTPTSRLGRWNPWLLGLLMVACASVWSRPPSAEFLVTPMLVIAISFAAARRWPLATIVTSLMDGLGIYLIANVVLHVAGSQSAISEQRVSGLDSSTGGERVFYPLANSLATPPLMAAVFVSAALLYLFTGNFLLRAFRVVATIAALTVMTEANTRLALVIAAVVALMVVLAPRILTRGAPFLALVPSALPFFYPFIAAPVIRPIVEAVTTRVPFLSRGDVTSDATLAGRSTIWDIATSFWSTELDAFHHLVGFGVRGPQESGASRLYGPLFRGLTENPLLLSAHSSSLEQLYDGGMVGLSAMVAAGVLLLLRSGALARKGSRAHLTLFAAALSAILGGATEVSMAPGKLQEPFLIFTVLLIAVARRREDEPRYEVEATDETAFSEPVPVEAQPGRLSRAASPGM